MTFETIRSLLYPLGFVANLLFGGRFLLQWIQSEKKGESCVSRSFWYISFFANLIMCIHGYIQLQYPICLIQALNAAIAWRNLNLMGKRVYRFSTAATLMALTVAGVTLLFVLQGQNEWMRQPRFPWGAVQTEKIALPWHLIGFFGMLLFASRYWIQWWLAEKHQKSFLGKLFWQMSCVGALFALVYAIRLADPVNIIGFSVGLLPYIRNLMLLKKASKAKKSIQNSHSFFLFAGEQSGDILGGNLIRALKKVSPSCELYGVGGMEMQKAGLNCTYPIQPFQVMGFLDVFKALPRLYKAFKKIQKEILQEHPKAVILIDYPDFNMRLAKSLRKKGYNGKVIHYVCPSVWAWRKKRIYSLAKNLDHLLSILPFEKGLFAKTTLPVTYVGHPLVAAIDQHTYEQQWKISSKPLIALFPGSRKQEIELNLPLQLAAAKKFSPSFSIAVSVAHPEAETWVKKYTDDSIVLVPSPKRYELMKEASAAIATSGTIILELGLHSVPTVTTYKLGLVNALLARYIFRVRLPFYTLVNIICEKEVYPEFIHKTISAEDVFQALKLLINNPESCKKECTRLRHLLTSDDASLKAAQIIKGVS